VKNGSLLAQDFKAGQLPAGAAGPQGAKGDPGTNGTDGAQGPPGPTEGTASDFYTRLNDTLPPQSILDGQKLTTTRAGKLFVSKALSDITATCSPSSSSFRVFPTLDGARVPGFVSKGYPSGSTIAELLTFTGVTASSGVTR
jgi:hypothetical protein